MAIPILNHLDLRSTAELRNALLHQTTTSAASNVEGKIIYDTGTNTLQYYSGGVNGGSAGWVNLDGAAQTNAFKTISVSGQDDVVADSTTDTLTLVAQGGMTITTSASGDTITLSSADTNTTTTADVLSALNSDFGGDKTFGTQTNDTVTFNGHITVGGNLTVNGTTTTVNSTTVTIDDPVFTLGGDSAPSSDDNKDRGIEFRYHDGSSAKLGFFGYDDSESEFVFLTGATNSSEVFSGTKGSINVDTAKVTTLNIDSVEISATGDEINILDGLTSSTTELNILDGVTATTAEINLIDGGTARQTTNAVSHGDGFLHNDGGTMRMTNVSKLADLFAGTNITATNSVLSVSNANTTTKGVVEIASQAETRAGTSTDVVPTIGGFASNRIKVATLDKDSITQANSFTARINHALATSDISVTLYDMTDEVQVLAEVSMVDGSNNASTNDVKIVFAGTPDNDIRVVIMSGAGGGTVTPTYG